jgi:hypothetical protein
MVLLNAATGTDPTPRTPAPAGPPSTAPAEALPPVRVAPPAAGTAAAQRSCQDLTAALPVRLGELAARPVDPPSPYTAAWGEPPVLLRCGVPRPPTFVVTVDTIVISGVAWFPERRGSTTAWTVVDRPVYVEVLAPAEALSAPAARLSAAVARSLPVRRPDPGR